MLKELIEEDETQAILKRKEEICQQKEDEKLKTYYRLVTLQDYFIRMSSQKKMSFLNDLLKGVSNPNTLFFILESLDPLKDKMEKYVAVSAENGLPEDQLLWDHNRTLDADVLKETIEDDLKWFNVLNDSDQFFVIISLMNIASDYISRKMYLKLQEHYKIRKLEEVPIDQPRQSDIDRKENYIFQYNPMDPLSIEVTKARKVWEDMLSKYATQIEEDKEKSFQDILAASLSASGKGFKIKLKSKGSTGLDIIQTLPIWIVKKIFSYLDKKSLTIARSVNEYWNYVVGDLEKDVKVRKILDERAEKLFAQIDPLVMKEVLKEQANLAAERTTSSPEEIRMKKLDYRGAVLEELLKTEDMPTVEKSLLVTILDDQVGSIWGNQISAFPIMARDESLSYKNKEDSFEKLDLSSTTLRIDRKTLPVTVPQDTIEIADDADPTNW